MKIVIVGWYGTETIGDRAILTGLLSFFSKAFNQYEVKIGSLIPFFTQRTINEDSVLWREIIKRDVSLNIFNSKRRVELDEAIKWADFIVMGGGPIMHIKSIYMIEYAFKKAKKLNKATAILGCGIGPLFFKPFRKAALEIVKHSDLVILRDRIAKQNLINIYTEFKQSIDPDLIYISLDPSIECCLRYNESKKTSDNEYIAINLRRFPSEYSKKGISEKINRKLKNIVERISLKYCCTEIKLIPMHYFHIGNDDREFLNEIKNNIGRENLTVQNRTLTLEETIDIFRNAQFNIGMRFHSIIVQTIMSGKNYILDYSDPKEGKIAGFLNEIDDDDFYSARYLSLQKGENEFDINWDVEKKYEVSKKKLEKKLSVYCNMICNLN